MYREAVAESILSMLQHDDKVLVLGEGVADPIGVFGTCLLARRVFPDRVIETPLSETMLTGACVGLALEGFKPIYVHARFDFALFSFEHLINTAVKIQATHRRDLPFVIRAIVGRGWGQGPNHGQNFAAALANVPGIRVFVPVSGESYAEFLEEALNGGPSVIVEHRRLYDSTRAPSYQVPSPVRCRVQVLAVGDACEEAREACSLLMSAGIPAHLVEVERLFLPGIRVLPSTPAVIVENGHSRFGVGAGLASQLASVIQAPTVVLCSPFEPLPASAALEPGWYLTSEQIVQAACRLLDVEAPREPAGVTSGWTRDGRKEAF